MENAVTTPTEQSAAPQNSNEPAQTPEATKSQNSLPPMEGQETNDSGKEVAKASASQEPELYEVTINGTPRKLTLEQMKNLASRGKAADEKFEEAAKIRKELESFKTTAAKDMIAALRQHGFTNEQIRDQMESWYMREYIEPETLTPEQRQLKQYEQQLKKYQEAEQEKQRAEQEEHLKQLTAKELQYLENQILTAVEKLGFEEKVPYIGSRIASYLLESRRQGWEPPLDLVVQQVMDETKANLRSVTKPLKGQHLIDFLGEELCDEIRRADLQRIRSRKQNMLGQYSYSNDGATNLPDRISSTEVNRRLREMRMGKR